MTCPSHTATWHRGCTCLQICVALSLVLFTLPLMPPMRPCKEVSSGKAQALVSPSQVPAMGCAGHGERTHGPANQTWVGSGSLSLVFWWRPNCTHLSPHQAGFPSSSLLWAQVPSKFPRVSRTHLGPQKSTVFGPAQKPWGHCQPLRS